MATVLVVEDVKIMGYAIKKTLEELGHNVIAEVQNGYDAIECYKEMQPDLVTMDITMPAKNGIRDGIEALIAIKEINNEANIIMLTSHGENKLVMKAVSNGARGYILKPITKEKVKDSLSKIGL